jgi:hypothetical protein
MAERIKKEQKSFLIENPNFCDKTDDRIANNGADDILLPTIITNDEKNV